MKEIPFSVPVSGTIRFNEDSVEIIVNKAETIVQFEREAEPGGRISFGPGMTMFDVILEAAQNVVRGKGANEFSGAELYHEALIRYPKLKRNSFTSHVIASSPNHPSQRHYSIKRNYFSYMGSGLYRLGGEYVPRNNSA